MTEVKYRSHLNVGLPDNNIIEQDHRFIRRLTRPMLGFKSFVPAVATLAGIETANMIRKVQLGPSTSGFRQFADLAG
ncbi:DDE-type integrase/transposase/recombinase [Ruegeria sp. 2205SS24-7]|nr:DDE-type integrase/transposase/recombinase [Ruegeria sp. 2205SS24-7]MDP5220352.1 DDE-type integrase/transposase/recombinase [Ruegeria sp. 2205SS24-7]